MTPKEQYIEEVVRELTGYVGFFIPDTHNEATREAYLAEASRQIRTALSDAWEAGRQDTENLASLAHQGFEDQKVTMAVASYREQLRAKISAIESWAEGDGRRKLIPVLEVLALLQEDQSESST